MNWNEKNIDILINLVNQGMTPKEISIKLGVTHKSINNIMFRKKINTVYKKEKKCESCGNIFKMYVKGTNRFCCKSCSVTFNNSKRKHSKDTKEKISKSLLRNLNKKNTKDQNNKEVNKKCCKICGKEFEIKFKQICEKCKNEYYNFYRSECNFNFNVYNYPDEFNLNLVKENGWYSPTNKKNNLKGVSKDHRYSVMDGFKNKINPKLISHPANCELILFSDNSKKKDRSNISIDELYNLINCWEIKYSKLE